MTAVAVSVLAGLAGAGLAAGVPSARTGVVVGVAMLVAWETAVARPILDDQDDVSVIRLWRRLELVGVVAGSKLVQIAAGAGALVDGEYLVTLVWALVVWAGVNATLTDLDAIDRGIGATDGLTPLQRIRLRFVGLGLVATTFAAFGAVGLRGLLDLERSAAVGLSAAPLGYFVFGAATVGLVARRSETRRWERDGASVDPDVGRSWRRAVVVAVAVVATLAVAVYAVPTGISALPVQGIAASGRFGEWISERAASLAAAVEAGSESSPAGTDPAVPPGAEFEPVEPVAPWLGDVALWLMLTLLFVSIIVRARRRAVEATPEGGGARFGDVVRMVATMVRDLALGLLRFLRGLVGGRSSDGREGASPPQSTAPEEWTSTDPVRRRIARAYRSSVDVLAGHHRRRIAETPREYARRIEDGGFVALTGTFEEARFSDHLLAEADAERAERESSGVRERHGGG